MPEAEEEDDMKVPTSDKWGQDGPLLDVLCSAKSDEPDTASVQRLRGRLIKAGLAVGISAASKGVAAAAQGAAAINSAAAIKGTIGLGLGVKIGMAVSVVAAVSVAVVQSPWVKENENAAAAEAAEDDHLRAEESYRSDEAIETPASDIHTSDVDTLAPDLPKEPAVKAPKVNRRKTTTVPKAEVRVPELDTDASKQSADPLGPASHIADEVRLIDEARSALSSNPEKALDLTKMHRASFGDGLLCTERDLITVNALFRLHRTEEACAAAAAFIQNNPGSAHIGRLKELCGGSLH